MDFMDKATQSLKAAESELRRLAGEAVRVGQYEEVQALAAWASQVADIYQSHAGRSGPTISESDGKGSPSPKKSVKRKGSYPRFTRSDDTIIKTSWSKKAKAEYEHRAPREVLELLLKQFKTIGGTRRPVTTEELFPLADQSGNPVPSYQSYLVLALLKQLELVEAHGRKGYTVQIGTKAPGDVASSVWKQLSLWIAK